MLRLLLGRALAAQERRVGVPLDYARDILRTSIPAFVKYSLVMPMATHRRRLPAADCYTARLAATVAEDCGSCLQIVANQALADGVPAAIVDAVIEGRVETLPQTLRDVWQFATAIATGEDDEALRARLRGRYGEEGLVELALAIASARVFPTAKRALGYAVSCAAYRGCAVRPPSPPPEDAAAPPLLPPE